MKANIRFVISRSFLLRMRNISNKRCRENQNTYFHSLIFFSKIMPFMRKCGKTLLELGSPQMTKGHMRIACWAPKATNTHPQAVQYTLFATATLVARTPLNATLYIYGLSFLLFILVVHKLNTSL